ncbi:MAG: hypothetical protein GWN54_05975, partial [Gammaproteobacteria bacterium]|nr:hypothetical protein [Gammaproteobacteria bacterium]
GLGRVEICYDNMEWVSRRSEPVRSGDQNVANYFGHLAFDLKGRYLQQGPPADLFAFRFRAPEEQHYMFAAASDEVLDDSCPVEWFGARIVTTLPEGQRGIVPNRLTYLSAPRTLPSRLLDLNWERGAEWRDWFVTGIGVRQQPVPALEDIAPSLNQHLQSLHRLEQKAVYGAVLQDDRDTDSKGLTPLSEEVSRLGMRKSLVRSQLMNLYPQSLYDDDTLRSAVAGHGGLLDAE